MALDIDICFSLVYAGIDRLLPSRNSQRCWPNGCNDGTLPPASSEMSVFCLCSGNTRFDSSFLYHVLATTVSTCSTGRFQPMIPFVHRRAPSSALPSKPFPYGRLRVASALSRFSCVSVEFCPLVMRCNAAVAGHHADLLLAGLPCGREGQRQVLREQPRAPCGRLPRHGRGGGEWLEIFQVCRCLILSCLHLIVGELWRTYIGDGRFL